MPDKASGIPTSSFDARPHMQPEHDPAVPAQSAVAFADLQRRVASLVVENVHLKTVNGQLRTGIRDVEGKMLRLFSELDATIARLTAAGGGKCG